MAAKLRVGLDAGWRRAVFDKQRSTAGLPRSLTFAWGSLSFNFFFLIMPAVLNPIALAVTHRFERWCIAHSQTGPRQVEAKLPWRCDLSTRSDTGTLAYFTDSTITFNVHLRCFLKNSFLKLTLRMTYLRGTTNRQDPRSTATQSLWRKAEILKPHSVV